jgi:Spy/CpxP family protein refolding chaperone
MMLPPGLDAPLPRGIRDLDLSDSQRDQLRDILNDWLDDNQALHDQLRDIRDESTAVWQSNTFDESKAREIAAKEAAAVEKLDTIGQQTQAKICVSVLTSDQRSQLSASAPPSGGPPRPPAPSVERQVDQMARGIDLTDDQKTKLTSILTDRDAARKSAGDKLKPIWDAYMNAHGNGTVDAGALQVALDKSAPILVDAITADLKSQSQTWIMLTPDQQEELKSMPPPGPMGGPRGPGGFGPGGPQDANQFGGPPPNGGMQGPPQGPPPGQGAPDGERPPPPSDDGQ